MIHANIGGQPGRNYNNVPTQINPSQERRNILLSETNTLRIEKNVLSRELQENPNDSKIRGALAAISKLLAENEAKLSELVDEIDFSEKLSEKNATHDIWGGYTDGDPEKKGVRKNTLN